MLAVRDESHPKCLWIYNPLTSKLLSLIVQLENISSARWRPTAQTVLAFCTGTSKVYFWRPSVLSSDGGEVTSIDVNSSGSSKDQTPIKIGITSIQWSSDGTHILLKGKEAYVACQYSFNADNESYFQKNLLGEVENENIIVL